jgi:hypothetical protein
MDAVMHYILVGLSIALLVISANGFRQRRTGRYFFLVLAFVFFFLDQSITLWQQLYLGDALVSIPDVGIHVTHLMEFLMSASFIAALLNPAGLRGPGR